MNKQFVVIKCPGATLPEKIQIGKAIRASAIVEPGQYMTLTETAILDRAILTCESSEKASKLIEDIKTLGFDAKPWKGPQ